MSAGRMFMMFVLVVILISCVATALNVPSSNSLNAVNPGVPEYQGDTVASKIFTMVAVAVVLYVLSRLFRPLWGGK
jgi:hypothetical protein